LNKIVTHLSLWMPLLVACVGIFRWWVIPRNLRTIVIIMICTFGAELHGYTMLFGIHAHIIIQNTFSYVLIILLFLLYWDTMVKRYGRVLYASFCVGSLAFLSIITFFVDDIGARPYWSWVLGNIFGITLCLASLRTLLEKGSDVILTQEPYFWITCAFLVSFSASTMLFAARQFLVSMPQKNLAYQIWMILGHINIITYLLILKGLWIKPRAIA